MEEADLAFLEIGKSMRGFANIFDGFGGSVVFGVGLLRLLSAPSEVFNGA